MINWNRATMKKMIFVSCYISTRIRNVLNHSASTNRTLSLTRENWKTIMRPARYEGLLVVISNGTTLFLVLVRARSIKRHPSQLNKLHVRLYLLWNSFERINHVLYSFRVLAKSRLRSRMDMFVFYTILEVTGNKFTEYPLDLEIDLYIQVELWEILQLRTIKLHHQAN